jgi:hypothetical protein
MNANLRMHAVLVVTLSLISVACGGTARTLGDPVAGEQLYTMNIEGVRKNHACSDCHSLDGTQIYAPSFLGISERVTEQIEGMTVEEYLQQSIVNPQAHIVGDFPYEMPIEYGEVLTEEQISDLIAFLLAQ